MVFLKDSKILLPKKGDVKQEPLSGLGNVSEITGDLW
jgi:hypothetical protein